MTSRFLRESEQQPAGERSAAAVNMTALRAPSLTMSSKRIAEKRARRRSEQAVQAWLRSLKG